MNNKRKIAILSNVTVGLIKQKLKRKYEVYIPEGFDTWVQEIINQSSGLYTQRLDAVVILLDGTVARNWKGKEDGLEMIKLWEEAILYLYSRLKEIPILVSTIDIRENRIRSLSERHYANEFQNDWYQFIQNMSETKKNIYCYDLANRIMDIGRQNFYSDKMWYISSMPYSKDGLAVVSNEIDKSIKVLFEPRKKIIAIDLDNTLWGRVIGEDGVEGIELSNHGGGQRFYDFQFQLKEMKNRGVLLAILSKNNEEDVRKVWKEHQYMLLRENDFVIKKINWEKKPFNLKEIEKDLNLTQSAFIFIDDNPMEREVMKGQCPEVLVADFPEDTTSLITFAEDIYCNNCMQVSVLADDIGKTRMYHAEEKRRQELDNSLSLDDYISKLEMSVDIHRMREEELDRVVQLCNKTNQFNLTTKRYTRANLQKISADSMNRIYVMCAKDKYGDSGLVSVIIFVGIDNHLQIDSFLMSCRVMGRKLENVIINEVIKSFGEQNVRLEAEYIPTKKNSPVKELYENLGFQYLGNEGSTKKYYLETRDYERENTIYIKNINFER